jgi:hypothetical protein
MGRLAGRPPWLRVSGRRAPAALSAINELLSRGFPSAGGRSCSRSASRILNSNTSCASGSGLDYELDETLFRWLSDTRWIGSPQRELKLL